MREETVIIDAQLAGLRIDKAAALAFPELSRSAVQALCRAGKVLSGGRPAGKSTVVSLGESLTVSVPDPEPSEATPQNIPLDIVYEDDWLLVVIKPKGMVVHPAPGNPDGTLVNALLYHCGGSLSGIGGVQRPGIVHRIDKDTSGLLIVAKNDAAHRALAEQIKVHDFQRTYETIIHGHVKQENFRINAPIGRNPNDRKKMCVTPKNSKNAVAHIQLLEEFPGFSWLRCTLETGRTHQIRVHLAYIGHPVAGDPVYGPKKPAFDCGGQCLHAKTIGFVHPFTGRTLHFTAPLPEYFTQILSTLRAARDGKEAEP